MPCSRMARRPDPAEFDEATTAAELEEHRRKLSLLSPQHVADTYRRAHEACRMDGDQVPRASAIQELVTAWKLMWGWRRRGRSTERGQRL